MKLAQFLTLAAAAAPRYAGAADLKPLPHPLGAPGQASTSNSRAQPSASPWTPLTNQPSFLLNGASSPVLLTDGSVLVQDAGFPDWWRLTPGENGSYVDGTWTQIASLPPSYSPLYHATAVLADGRMIIEGGEYLLNDSQTALIPTWSAQGAIYDPVADTWTQVAPPPFFTGFGPFAQTIGDAQAVVLANGTYMQANCCQREAALLDLATLTWSPTGTGKLTIYDEEGWTLLPNGKVLTTDAYVGDYDPAGLASEIYDPATGAWTYAGSTVTQLWDSAADCGGIAFASYEVGPSVLRPDGTVFFTGANQCAAGHTAVYDSRSGRWSAGPDFPDSLNIADGPAALETNGKVLMMASPGLFSTPSVFLEWDGSALTEVEGPPNAPFDSSYYGNMLVLPTGQILLTDFSNDIELYTPAANRHPPSYRPEIDCAPETVRRGHTYSISGQRFNGVSQGAAYGDDAMSATNYPLVRITNVRTGHVFYSRTHDHSSMAVASRRVVSTSFDVPSNQETGRSRLEVVANGITSAPVYVTVR